MVVQELGPATGRGPDRQVQDSSTARVAGFHAAVASAQLQIDATVKSLTMAGARAIYFTQMVAGLPYSIVFPTTPIGTPRKQTGRASYLLGVSPAPWAVAVAVAIAITNWSLV